MNPNAAGIDVGREKLLVSLAGEAPVVFGTGTEEVYRLRDFLKQKGGTSVALEAPGVYWLYAYGVLEAAGLEGIVVNGRDVRNLPGRKTDRSDGQWLATWQAPGLLRGGFVPPAEIRRRQDDPRLRADPLSEAASQGQKRPQALERMHIKCHDVLSDLTGVRGMKVIQAILAGERQPARLLARGDQQIQKKKSERVLESLHGVWASEHLFALGPALSVWKFQQKLLTECDQQIEGVLKDLAGPPPSSPPSSPASGPAKSSTPQPPGKNAPQIDDWHALLVRLCGGRDATSLPGGADYLGLQLVAQTGTDLSAWTTEKHFPAWGGLAPGPRQSGKRKGSVKRQRHRAGRLFCAGARSLVPSVDKGLGGFVRRLSRRKGGLGATKALARKLAGLQYRVLRDGLEYAERGLREYEQKDEESQRRLLGKLAAKHGFKLVSEQAPAM